MRLTVGLIIGILLCLFWFNGAVYPQHSVCGNGICENDEDCENCSQDCGVCHTSTSGDDLEPPTTPITIEEELQIKQLKIKRTTDFSLKDGAIDDLHVLWP